MSVFKYRKIESQSPFDISLPASKSISNRLLLLNSLFDYVLELENISTADDTLIFQENLKIMKEENDVEIDVKDAGTVCRFLLAYAAMCKGKTFSFIGTPRMYKRPLKALIEALQKLGANILCKEKEGFLPCEVKGAILKNKKIVIDGSASSQFISALCMIACKIENGLEITIKQNAVSYSYINMTLQLMNKLGIQVFNHHHEIRIENTSYIYPQKLLVENDWSAASFFYSMIMIDPNLHFAFENLPIDSIQGDCEIVNIAKQFNIETHVDNGITNVFFKENNELIHNVIIDITNVPDMAIPLIVACGFKYPKVFFSGFSHLQYKESNRIEALQNELLHWNIQLIMNDDLLSFDSTNMLLDTDKIINVKTYNDHRIAMAFTLPLLLGYQIQYDDTACVSKSFPDFWNQVKKMGIGC